MDPAPLPHYEPCFNLADPSLRDHQQPDATAPFPTPTTPTRLPPTLFLSPSSLPKAALVEWQVSLHTGKPAHPITIDYTDDDADDAVTPPVWKAESGWEEGVFVEGEARWGVAVLEGVGESSFSSFRFPIVSIETVVLILLCQLLSSVQQTPSPRSPTSPKPSSAPLSSRPSPSASSTFPQSHLQLVSPFASSFSIPADPMHGLTSPLFFLRSFVQSALPSSPSWPPRRTRPSQP